MFFHFLETKHIDRDCWAPCDYLNALVIENPHLASVPGENDGLYKWTQQRNLVCDKSSIHLQYFNVEPNEIKWEVWNIYSSGYKPYHNCSLCFMFKFHWWHLKISGLTNKYLYIDINISEGSISLYFFFHIFLANSFKRLNCGDEEVSCSKHCQISSCI